MIESEFNNHFKLLTGNPPLRWQLRMFRECFAKSKSTSLPASVDLPTGLGKTMVMAIWLIARASNPSLPRRLVYVVDRRAVGHYAGANSGMSPPARTVSQWLSVT